MSQRTCTNLQECDRTRHLFHSCVQDSDKSEAK